MAPLLVRESATPNRLHLVTNEAQRDRPARSGAATTVARARTILRHGPQNYKIFGEGADNDLASATHPLTRSTPPTGVIMPNRGTSRITRR